MALALKRKKLTLAKHGGGSWEISGMVSPSGRWALHRTEEGSKFYSVSHVPTGVLARSKVSHAQARAMVEAFEPIETPLLDAMAFGQIPKELPEKQELFPIRDRLFEIVRGSF